MHLIRTDFSLLTTRATEFQRQGDRRASALEGQPGYRGMFLLNSLGYPVMQMSPMYFHRTRYVMYTLWDSAAAAEACFASDDWDRFSVRHDSEELFRAHESQHHYESLQELDAHGDHAPFAWMLSRDASGSAEDTRGTRESLTALGEAYREHLPGFVESYLLEDAATPGNFVLLSLLTGQTGFPPGADVPAIRELYEARFPDVADAEELTPEGFNVVHRSHV